ncbi:MAG: glucose-6-phosphate dehydrogenase assembly protein OpcA [bacterium]|nr:glucose-6-phosphate dehydrogenase assembly protein OpcA [bacterium]
MSAAPEYEVLTSPHLIELDRVERELVRLRLEAPTCVEAQAVDEQPITRACMSNLIVYCDNREQADALPAQFATMARRHPARIILLVGEDPGQPQQMRARISAGLANLGKRRQISSEQVRISAAAEGHRRLAAAARPLLIGDLPTALWWNSTQPPPNGGDLFLELQEMANSVVYDSRGWSDPRAGFVATAAWALGARTRTLVTDLAWMRLRFWRRLFGETLAPHVLPGALHNIERIEFEHGPHALPMVWLFTGWLAHCLSWKPLGGTVTSGKHLNMNFQSSSGPVRIEVERNDSGPAELRRATVVSRGAGLAAARLEAEFETLDSERLAIRIDHTDLTENVISTPNDPPIVMLAWQLANRTGLLEFREALQIAQAMAKALGN